MGWHSKSCLALCAEAALVEGFGSSDGAVLMAVAPLVIVGGCAAFALTWRAQCSWNASPS